MIRLRKVCDLDVSAASGLCVAAGRLWVVADDELALASYQLDGTPAGHIALFPGVAALPEEHDARKRAKPDLEALAVLPDGALLALGSGSRPNRMQAAIVQPATGATRLVDLAPLYRRLHDDLPELNIEGAAASEGRFRLLQRGNGPARVNAVIDLDLPGLLAALAAGRPLDGALVQRIVRVELGALDGVPLSFTDAAAIPGSDDLLFSAAAEASATTYDDGPCAGSVVGRLTRDGALLATDLLEPSSCKIEGLTLAPTGDLLLVADADDRRVRSPLYAASYLTA